MIKLLVFTKRNLHIYATNCQFNPSRPNPKQWEKIKLNFYFLTSLWCLKGFIKALKAFIKPFEGPQRSVKIKFSLNIYCNTTFRNAWDVKG